MRVASWNIWAKKNWDEVAGFIKDNQIDIIGLQEVDRNMERTGLADVPALIADKLGYHHAYCVSIDFKPGLYGNCIISRFPITSSEIHFLDEHRTYKGDHYTEPRTLLETSIDIGNKKMTFMTLHLGYSDRFESTEIKKTQIMNVIRSIKDERLVLVGDFNSLPESYEISAVKRYLTDTDPQSLPTWPIVRHSYNGWTVEGLKYKIDYIFISHDIKCKAFMVGESKASDHLPIIADINI